MITNFITSFSNFVKYIFNESSSKKEVFSVRKFLAIIVGIAFVIAVIMFGIKHNWVELPTSYLTIIGGVFIFYFAKKIVSGVSLKSEKDVLDS